jgi:hypothetical protein
MSLANRPVESRPTERRRGAKLGLARTLSNKWLALLVVAGAALAIAFGYCLIAIQSVEISSMAAAVSFAAFEASLLFSYAIYQSQKIALVDLQKDLRPQIKVLGLRKRVNSVNNERSFDLIVRNDGAEAIENCSAVVSSIRIVRYSKPRGEQTLDVSSLYAQELPLALAVPAGPDLILSDSFRLRPSEIRRIPVCSRLDGQRNPLQIYFAADSPLRQAPDFAFGEIGLAILGEATELHEKLHLSVRDNGVLEVSRAA